MEPFTDGSLRTPDKLRLEAYVLQMAEEDSPTSWWQQGVINQLAAVATTINMERRAVATLSLLDDSTCTLTSLAICYA